MLFKGQPNLCVIDRKAKPRKKVYVFDADGFAEVNDPKYIERMKRKFEVYNAEAEQKETKSAKAQTVICKYCGKEIEKKLLLAHYNQNHRGEKK